MVTILFGFLVSLDDEVPEADRLRNRVVIMENFWGSQRDHKNGLKYSSSLRCIGV